MLLKTAWNTQKGWSGPMPHTHTPHLEWKQSFTRKHGTWSGGRWHMAVLNATERVVVLNARRMLFFPPPSAVVISITFPEWEKSGSRSLVQEGCPQVQSSDHRNNVVYWVPLSQTLLLSRSLFFRLVSVKAARSRDRSAYLYFHWIVFWNNRIWITYNITFPRCATSALEGLQCCPHNSNLFRPLPGWCKSSNDAGLLLCEDRTSFLCFY